LCLVASTTGGCDESDAASYLAISLPTEPLTVDVSCTGADCDSATLLDVTIDWTRDPTQLPPDSEIDLYEYKIEYGFPDIVTEIPYYADKSQQVITAGGEVAFSVIAMGADQRAALAPYVTGAKVVAGTGSITFAGWDETDQVLTSVPVPFDVELTTSSGAATETGTDASTTP
jgi:hypothetical protein